VASQHLVSEASISGNWCRRLNPFLFLDSVIRDCPSQDIDHDECQHRDSNVHCKTDVAQDPTIVANMLEFGIGHLAICPANDYAEGREDAGPCVESRPPPEAQTRSRHRCKGWGPVVHAAIRT